MYKWKTRPLFIWKQNKTKQNKTKQNKTKQNQQNELMDMMTQQTISCVMYIKSFHLNSLHESFFNFN